MRLKQWFVLILSVFLFVGNVWCTPLDLVAFDKAEFKARRARLMELIPDGVAVILGAEEAQPYERFFQNNDFMYFVGLEQPDAALIIDGIKKEALLFLPAVSPERRFPRMVPGEKAVDITGIAKILPLTRFTSTLLAYQTEVENLYTPFQPQEKLTHCGRNNTLYFMNRTLDPWDGRPSREMNFIRLIRERFPNFRIKDLSPHIAGLRMIKTPAEIALMREAGRISSLAHIEILKAAKPGMYEWELAALYEYSVKRLGCAGHAYSPIVASGPSIFYSGYSENCRRIKDGDMVLVDMGGDYKYYDIDISLAFPINGKFSKRQRELNKIVLAVRNAMQKVFRPGIRSIDMRDEVAALVAEQGIDVDKEQVARIWADHWIGMAVHDDGPSSRTTVLRPGMVIACDPSIRLKDEGTGNKIEDTVLITENGCENLTPLVPRSIEEIERIMAEPGITDWFRTREKK